MKLPDLRKTRLSSVSTFGVVSILGTSMIIIAIVAIAAIRGAGAYSLKQTKEAIKTEAVKLLKENTKRKASDYTKVFEEGLFYTDILGKQIIKLLKHKNSLSLGDNEINKIKNDYIRKSVNNPFLYKSSDNLVWCFYWKNNLQEVMDELYIIGNESEVFHKIALTEKGFYAVTLSDLYYYIDYLCYRDKMPYLSSVPSKLKSNILKEQNLKDNLKNPYQYITSIYRDFYNDYLCISMFTNFVPIEKKYKVIVSVDVLFQRITKDILFHKVPFILPNSKNKKNINNNSYIISGKDYGVIAMSTNLYTKLKLPAKNPSKYESMEEVKVHLTDSKLKGVRSFAKAISNRQYGIKFINIGKQEYIFCYYNMSIKDWIFGVAVPTKELYRAVAETEARMGVTVMGFIINFLMVAVFFMFILLIVVVLFFKTYLVKPILSFRDNVLQMGDGDLDTPIKERGVYEISVLANSFNNLRVDLKNHMDGLRSEVVKRQKRDNELKTARQVQLSVLPKITSLFDNKGIELYAKLLPAIDVAGDYYDFFFLENKKLALIIADVSGKGISASFYMAVTKRTLRNTCITEPDDPAKSIELANKILCSYNINMFVTLFLAYYDTETGEMVYANGGHNEVICLKNDGSLDVFGVLNCAALGTFPELPYVKDSYTLDHGDTIYVYTDGIIEANTGDENFYGMKRFEDLLVKNREKSLSKICKLVIQDVHQFEKGGQFDDITILALKRE